MFKHEPQPKNAMTRAVPAMFPGTCPFPSSHGGVRGRRGCRICPSNAAQGKKTKTSRDAKIIRKSNEQKLERTKFECGSQRAGGRSKLVYTAKSQKWN